MNAKRFFLPVAWLAAGIFVCAASARAEEAAVPPAAAKAQLELRTFDVRAEAVQSYFIDGDKIKKTGGGDQAIYFVDLPNKIIKRVAVYYARKKKSEKILPGLYSKPQEYTLISYKHDFMKDQLIVKAMAQTEGDDDGFETLVIGEDFVASSISAKGYFTVTYYDRTDDEAMAFKRKHGKLKEEEQEEETFQPRHRSKPQHVEVAEAPADNAMEWFSSRVNRFNHWRKQTD